VEAWYTFHLKLATKAFVPLISCNVRSFLHLCADNDNLTVFMTDPGAEVLYRSCSPENICSVLAAQYENSPYDSVKECKVCDQDECNSASVAILSLGVVSVALLLHQVL
jgi:hypothetical protein